jgi:hypothetical protein
VPRLLEKIKLKKPLIYIIYHNTGPGCFPQETSSSDLGGLFESSSIIQNFDPFRKLEALDYLQQAVKTALMLYFF